MNTKQLEQLTLDLIDLNQTAKKRFEYTKQSSVMADFYQEIKPFVDQVKEVSETWGVVARNCLSSVRPTHIHLSQIDNTIEHMQTVAVQSFIPTASRTRFLNVVNSVDYILKIVLNSCQQSD